MEKSASVLSRIQSSRVESSADRCSAGAIVIVDDDAEFDRRSSGRIQGLAHGPRRISRLLGITFVTGPSEVRPWRGHVHFLPGFPAYVANEGSAAAWQYVEPERVSKSVCPNLGSV